MVKVQAGQASAGIVDGLDEGVGEAGEVVALVGDQDGLSVVKDLKVIALHEAVGDREEERLVRANVEGARGEGVAPGIRERVETGIREDIDAIAVPATGLLRLLPVL